jgi:hypothetical protein
MKIKLNALGSVDNYIRAEHSNNVYSKNWKLKILNYSLFKNAKWYEIKKNT